MPGSKIGGSKIKMTYIRKFMEADPTLTVEQAEVKYKEVLAERGRIGGQRGHTGGFASMNKLKHRQVSAKGGSRGKRTKEANE